MGSEQKVIERDFRVRFAQIDGAHVIYYPRYLEIVADTFPEAAMTNPPFNLAIRFVQSNRLGDLLKLRLQIDGDRWEVSGAMPDGDGLSEHFNIALAAGDGDIVDDGPAEEVDLGVLGDWMCGSDHRLHLSRYYELVSDAVERWFESTLSMTFHELHIAQQIGIPTIRLDTVCHSLPKAGDALSMRLKPLVVGSSAVQFRTTLMRAGQPLIQTRQVIVFVKLMNDSIEKMSIPDWLRQPLAEQLAASGSG